MSDQHDKRYESKAEAWDRYQARHADASFDGGVEQVSKAVDFWVDAWKEHSGAGIGWAQEIIQKREYPLSRVVPDVLTFWSGAFNTASDWYRFVTSKGPGPK